jgi:ABC-type amino acid transport substrate-binding protein
MRCLKVIIFIILVIFAGEVCAADTLVVRVSQWPPQYFQDDNGNWTGVEVELAAALLDAAGFKIKFVSQPWKRGIESMKNGTVHLLTSVAMKPERKEFIQWIGRSRDSTVSMVVKKGNENLNMNSLDDMIKVSKKLKKKFGHQIGAFWSEEFNARLDKDPTFAACFEQVPKGAHNIKKLNEDRIIGFFEDRQGVAYRIKTDPDYAELAVHSFILNRRPTYFGVSKKGVDTVALNKIFIAYEKLTRDGTFDRIRKKWGY